MKELNYKSIHCFFENKTWLIYWKQSNVSNQNNAWYKTCIETSIGSITFVYTEPTRVSSGNLNVVDTWEEQTLCTDERFDWSICAIANTKSCNIVFWEIIYMAHFGQLENPWDMMLQEFYVLSFSLQQLLYFLHLIFLIMCSDRFNFP